MIKVGVVDDHSLVREGTVKLVKEISDFEICFECGNGQEALEAFKKDIPDILITDVSMPYISGFELIEKVKVLFPQVVCIIISMHYNPTYINKAKKIGVKSFLLKEYDSSRIKLLISESYKGISHFPVYDGAVDGLNIRFEDTERLTERESEVVFWISNGLTNKEIAVKLNLSIRTVDAHRHNVFNKLRVNNVAELIKKSIKMGIVKFD